VRLEYLSDGSPDCPLIRLFDFAPAEAAWLGSAMTDLATGRAERVAVHELAFIEPVGGCELVLSVRAWHQGVVRVGAAAFECGLPASAWANVAGLVEPFAAGSGGYQWLSVVPGEASLLLSVSGQW
jgi:hypothetical protein